MASPTQANGVHPSTPPATDPSAPNTAAQSRPDLPPDAPRTSLQDSGEAKRPREARLIHLVLATMGINSYQERVPLQLLDFAYRYTSSVLSDSLRLSGEGYAGANEPRGRGRGGGGGANPGGDAGSEGITLQSLRQAIASRQGFTFVNHLPKEWMLEQAEQHNKIALPKIETRAYGLQLPPEQYCLNGVGWGLKEEWSDEEEVKDDEPDQAAKIEKKDDARMGGMDEEDGDEDEDEDEEGAGRMEDVFGDDHEGDAKMGDQE